MKLKMITQICTAMVFLLITLNYGKEDKGKTDPWLGWHRPVDANVFVTTKGNNHDSLLFVESELE